MHTEADCEELIWQDRFSEAFALARPLAEAGIAWAQSAIGSFYLTGVGAPAADPQEAETWLLKAAEQGNAIACVNLVALYTAQLHNSDKAEFYKRRSVELGAPFFQKQT